MIGPGPELGIGIGLGWKANVDAVLFNIGRRRYALELDQVDAVVPLGPITPVPCTSAAVLGAMNVRGQVMAVIDPAALVGEASGAGGERAERAKGDAPATGIGLLSHAEGCQVVLRVERVEGVVPLAAPPEEPPPVVLELDQLLRELLAQLGRAATPG